MVVSPGRCWCSPGHVIKGMSSGLTHPLSASSALSTNSTDAGGRCVWPLSSSVRPRPQQIVETDAAEHFGPDAICNAVDDLRTVLRRIDMGAERTGAERSRDDIDDGNGNRCRIRVGGFEGSQALQRLIGYPGVRTVVIFSDARRIGGRPRMGEMVGALRKSTWHDDRRFDAPARQFSGIGDGQ